MIDTAPQVSPSRQRRLIFGEPLTIYQADAFKTQLQAALEPADCERLELDLSQVNDIDTAGLQLLLLAQRESQRLQRSLHIVGITEAVREVITFCGLDDFLMAVPTPNDQVAEQPDPHGSPSPA